MPSLIDQVHFPLDTALALVVSLLFLQPRHELLVTALGVPPVAYIDVLSVVLDFDKMEEGVVLVQFDGEVGCELGRTDAVEAGDCLPLPLLFDALGTGQIQ